MAKLFKKLASRSPGSKFAEKFGVSGSQRYTGIRPPGPGDYQDIQDPLDTPNRPGPRGPGGPAGGRRRRLGPGEQMR